MLVNHSHVLEVRELKDNRIIICYIQIADRSMEYYHGQATPHKTYRWMQADDWAKFDANLEMMFGNQAANISLDKLREHTFRLNASIQVRVTKCRIPVDAIKRCIIDAPESWGAVLAFEFFIEYKEYQTPKNTQVDNTVDCVSDGLQNSKEDDQNHEYEPPFVSSQPDGACVPYTPSPKTKSILNVKVDNISETPDEEAYSPKPLTLENMPNDNNESPSRVPSYKPSRMILEKQGKSIDIQTVKPIKEKNGHNDDEIENDRKKRRDKTKQKIHFDEKRSRDKKHQTEHKLEAREKDKRREESKITIKHEDDKKHEDQKPKRTQNEDGSDNDIKEKPEKLAFEANGNSSTISSNDVPIRNEKRKRNLVNYKEELSQPRRSSRSPTKPKRFIEEFTDKIEVQSNRSSSRSPKRLKNKSSKVCEDLFGSDDDEDEKLYSDFVTNELPKIKSTHSKMSREETKKKRKHTSTPDCSSEKRGMDSWLGKKMTKTPTSSATTTTTSSKHKDTKSSKSSSSANVKTSKTSNDSPPLHPSSSSAPLPVAYLSKEEIEENILREKLQLENNSKIKEMLKQIAGPTPEKVETLNIKNFSRKYILNSFEQYKPQLDDIFRNSMKKAHKIKGYEGVNNYMVMSLIDKNIPLDMMNKLQDTYDPDCEGIPTYTSIFANAMMPEWIIRLFMDKHKLTREEAIKHVKAQEEYQLHLKSKIESPTTE